MTCKVEERIDDHIIIFTITPPIKFPEDVEIPLTSSVAFKEKAGTPICRIMDFSGSNLQFSEMVMGLGGEKGKPGGFWDPEVYHVIIGDLEWVKFGIETMQKQTQYQGAKAEKIVGSREEAIELAESLLKK